MHPHAHTAVELTKGDDHLSIWVDANNNGVRDDDDVNIFVTKSGGFYTESPTFKHALDAHLREKLKEASLALLIAGHDPVAEDTICDLALQLVLDATREQPAAVAEAEQPLPPAYYPPLA